MVEYIPKTVLLADKRPRERHKLISILQAISDRVSVLVAKDCESALTLVTKIKGHEKVTVHGEDEPQRQEKIDLVIIGYVNELRCDLEASIKIMEQIGLRVLDLSIMLSPDSGRIGERTESILRQAFMERLGSISNEIADLDGDHSFDNSLITRLYKLDAEYTQQNVLATFQSLIDAGIDSDEKLTNAFSENGEDRRKWPDGIGQGRIEIIKEYLSMKKAEELKSSQK